MMPCYNLRPWCDPRKKKKKKKKKRRRKMHKIICIYLNLYFVCLFFLLEISMTYGCRLESNLLALA